MATEQQAVKNIDKNSLGNYHLKISLWIFLISLAFPAFYVNEDYEPMYAVLVFALGWLAIFDMQFTWYANALLILAVMFRKDLQKSTVFAFISIVLAITFPMYKEVLLGYNVAYEKDHGKIVGYGFGYFFWIISIGIFFIGQLILTSTDENNKRLYAIATSFIFIVIVAALFSHHFHISKSGIHALNLERNEIFEARCQSENEKIYRNITEKVDSVYMRNVGRIELRGNIFNFWRKSGTGSADASIPGISFYEEDNRHTHTKENVKFLFVSHDRKTRKATYSDTLKSRYMIEATKIPFSKRLGIRGEKIEVIDLLTDTIVAESSYFFQEKGGRLCGEVLSRRYSNTDFFSRVFTKNQSQ